LTRRVGAAENAVAEATWVTLIIDALVKITATCVKWNAFFGRIAVCPPSHDITFLACGVLDWHRLCARRVVVAAFAPALLPLPVIPRYALFWFAGTLPS
jgi:hypothetical protein